MELLQTTFLGRGDQKGWVFDCLKRENDTAIYKKTDTETENIYFEVIKIRIQKERNSVINGIEIHFEAKEFYPRSDDFGVFGWTYPTLELAESKFESCKHLTND